MELIAYLNFDGRCAEAFRFYHGVLGGTLEITTFRDSPMAGELSPEWQDRVMHARLVVGQAVLMASDTPPGQYARPQGFAVTINVEDAAEAERVFHALTDGGRVTMPIEKTFWAERFGMLVDRFGIPWIINGGSAA